MLLAEIRQSISRKETFALESTLSGRTHIRIFELALAAGFEIELHYLWLANLNRRSRVSADAFGWEGMTFPRGIFADDSNAVASTWSPTTFLWLRDGPSGTAAAFLRKRLATSAADDLDSVRQLIDL